MKLYGRGRVGRKPPGKMNKLEVAYGEQLFAWKVCGEIVWYEFEAITFVLTHGGGGVKGQRYTPDFVVMRPNGMIECHEVKGFRDEKNINKLKVAAAKFPFRFLLVEKKGGEWVFQEYGDATEPTTEATEE